MTDPASPREHRVLAPADLARIMGLYHEFAPRLTKMLRNQHPDADAEQAVADAFLQLCMKWYTIEGDPAGLLTMIARRRLHDQRRHDERTRALQHSDRVMRTCPIASQKDAEIRIASLQAMQAIPPAIAKTLFRHYYEELTVEEIAHERGCRESTVHEELSRGRKCLAELLEGRRRSPRPPADEDRSS
ncbi:hypothetical protein CFN78_23760 [Amycolatopsis antarctica]|uniref:RNA polymerase sigma factor 70 region 4 type 2 domain-containing protein n=1 Tax=Amycolatopsis antarctica TaxID=1854586 RepID=A0A263CX21_9PSEU|nr:RNA polymerase sigma factor [Amycolatopsis antarctica]OZM70693.1 hypothetical protein CFN78_23760 [Amycolatopsis antarctica]